jgi:hypothetical protein
MNTEIGFSLQCWIPLCNVYVQGILTKRPVTRVSSNWKKNFGSNQNKPKQDLFHVFRFVSWNQKLKFSVCFGVLNLYWNNRNKQNCFDSNQNKRNNPKFSEKYQNMLSIKLFWMVFCLFWFNRNIETRCSGIEFETTETKCFKTNRNNTKFYEKIPIYSMFSIKLFRLVFCLFRFNRNTETFRFRIEAKQPKQTFCFG